LVNKVTSEQSARKVSTGTNFPWKKRFPSGIRFPKRVNCVPHREIDEPWLEYHPLVKSYARGDISPQFAATYRLPIPHHAPFTIGYTFESKPHHYLPDVVGTLTNGQPF
jgi:hypothetical protein